MIKRLVLVLSLGWATAPLFAATGISVGSPGFGPAKFSNGLIASSDSNYIALPVGDLNITATSSWTIGVWLNTTSSANSMAVSIGTSAAANLWMGMPSFGNGHFTASVSGTGAFTGGAQLDSGVAINDGNWHYCVMQMSGGTTITLYVDGVQRGVFTGQIAAIATGGAIGRWAYTNGFAWRGSIDEVSFWNAAVNISTPPTAPFAGTEANLQALYHLEADGTDNKGGGGGTQGSAKSGAVIGSPGFGPAKFSNGLIASSDSNYIALPVGDLNITATSSWTIGVWLNTTSSANSMAVSIGTSAAANLWMGMPSFGNGHFTASVSGTGAFTGGAQLDSGVAINDGNWHYCVMQMSGGTTITLYVDGVQRGVFTGQIAAIATGGAIGRWAYTNGFAWRGSIDEVSFWNAAVNISTPPTAPFAGTEANLQALFHLEADGVDSSGASTGGSLAVTTVSLPNATAGAPYSQAIVASGGTSPYFWSIQSGSLPAGLNLASSSGIVSGTPTLSGPNSFVASVTDHVSNTATANLSIMVNAPSFTDVSMSSSAILYSPYNWVVTSASATTINSGAYFRTIFSGTSVALLTNTANNGSPYSELWARVDGDAWQELTLAAGNPKLSIATALQNRNHLLEVIVKSTSETISRWSNSATMVTLAGIELDPGSTLTAPLSRSKHILIYGDSVTEGVRTVNATASNDTDRNDVLSDYAYALANAVDAEVGIVAFGASGVTATGSGGVPPLPSSYNLVYSGAPRSFSPAPDLVIYNEGRNDSASITSGLVTVVDALIAIAPSSKHLLLTPLTSPTHVSDIQAVVTTIHSANVTMQNTAGWFNPADSSDGLHPYGYSHLGFIAPQLFPIVERLLYPVTGP